LIPIRKPCCKRICFERSCRFPLHMARHDRKEWRPDEFHNFECYWAT
jgi:hypothetical protein